jgi:hypothetical protein
VRRVRRRRSRVSSGIQTGCWILWIKQRVTDFMKILQILILLPLLQLAACTPTVQLASPSEPITINLNVKIEHEVRVKVDRELEDVFAQNSDLF